MVLPKWNQPVSVAMPAKSAWAIFGVMGQWANRNRLELDLGFSSNHAADNYYNSWSVAGLYHWVWKLDKQLYWYVGPGGKIGGWNYDRINSSYNNGFFLAAAGDLGIEYVFPVGIQLAMNARPELGLINRGSGLNVGFAVRYQF